MSERLWIGNVRPGASNEELVDLVKKSSGRGCKVVQHVDADGGGARCVMEFAGLELGELDEIARRIAGLFWKERTLTVYHPLHPS